MKAFSFFYHYNKPASLKRGRTTISLHYCGKCHLVEEVDCYVHTASRIKKMSPRFVMTGKAHDIHIVDDKALII